MGKEERKGKERGISGGTNPKIVYVMSRCGADPRSIEKDEVPELGSS